MKAARVELVDKATVFDPRLALIAGHGFLVAFLGPVAGIVVWLLPLGLEPTIQKVFAVVTFMVIYWISEPVEHAVTALIGCYLFWALEVVKPAVAFSGFASTTPWFLFGALLMGEAASRTGLSKRFGYLVMQRVGVSYSQLILGVVTLAFLLNFLIPSGMARLTVVAPIVIGIVSAFGLGAGSNVGKGLFLILTYTCALFDRMILSGAASILARGIIEDQTGIEILWSEWLLAFLPAAVVTIAVSWWMIQWLFPPERNELPDGKGYLEISRRALGSWSGEEKRALAWLLLAIGLWSKDSIHHISPAVITVGIGLLLVFPRMGVLEGKALKQINFLTIIFSAGALSMANVLAHTGAVKSLTSVLAGWIEPLLTGPVFSAFLLYWAAFFYHFLLATDQSMLSTSLPVLIEVANIQGLNPVSLALMWTFATGARLFVYQSSVLVLGYSYGYFGCRDLVKVGAVMTLVEGIVLLFLVGLYWPMIGMSLFPY
ncbi:MAG: SLC13 family permease [Candidatus Binatia bacterium]